MAIVTSVLKNYNIIPENLYNRHFDHREYILRAAVLLITGALTIDPVSIFSGNVACLGLKQGCSAETEPILDLLSLAYQAAQFWSVF